MSTPKLDAYKARQSKIDKDNILTDLSLLGIGDFVNIGRSNNSYGCTGFVKKVNPKNIIIETIYGGYGDSDVELMELSFPKSRVDKFLKQNPSPELISDINGKTIKVGDTVKTMQPGGGILPPGKPETGIVEITKNAFGITTLQIKYQRNGVDRFILLGGKINEIIPGA